MKKYIKYFTLALTSAFVMAASSCEKPAQENVEDNTPVETVYTNTYEYADKSYEIKSVVRFQTTTTVEMWFSSVENLTTIEQIVEKGDYGVISVNRTYLGGRDMFRKAGSYIAFNGFRYEGGSNAKAFIEMAIDEASVKFNFKAETLFDNGTAIGKGFIGSYDGAFVEHQQNLVNQWSHNRVVKNILKAKVFVNMDNDYNTTTKFAFYDDEAYMHEAVAVTLPQANVGTEATELSDIVSVTYDNGKEFSLANSANINKLLATLTDDNATLDMDLVNGSQLLAADFSGKVVLNESKPNHISYTTYEKSGDSWNELATRRYPVTRLIVKGGSSSTRFYFPTIEDASSDYLNSYPLLSVETKYIDGEYHFADDAVGRFKFSDEHNTISDQPFGDNAGPKATMCLTRVDDYTYKIVLRIQDLEISLSKKADVEVFYEGTFSN